MSDLDFDLSKQIAAEGNRLRAALSGGGNAASTAGTEELPEGAMAMMAPATSGRSVDFGGPKFAEAIIVVDRSERPALLIRNNTFEQPTLKLWKTNLNANRTKLENALLSVGRLEIEGLSGIPYGGTAWMIAPGYAVTNRHVAQIFARKQGSTFKVLSGPDGPYKPKIDYREEYQGSSANEVYVEKVVFISEPGDNNPDVAILKLRTDSILPDPIPLFDGKLQKDQPVAAIGYPASDFSRNPGQAVVFGDIYEVKRLAPGFITNASSKGFLLEHDCSTLGGNSGSALIDIPTGHAVGLHFSGQYRIANYAVTAERLKKILTSLKIQIAIPLDVAEAAKKKPRKPAPAKAVRSLDGREGYSAQFLGDAKAVKVPLPALPAAKKGDLAEIKGTTDNLLHYTHFSIAMSKERRFAHYTAVNIDGSSSVNFRRSDDKWNFDPRLPESAQFGDDLYKGNDLDRGHLVRRLDPVWGAEAEQANFDTFYFTNSTPQHARLNQKTWNDLEDYILTNTSAHGLRVCVFTGPVFGKNDPEYRGALLPEQYWKVVTVLNGETKKLHTTAYILSQKDLITNLEFVFGQFRTYQLPVEKLAGLVKLNFNGLEKFDPLRGVETFATREISQLSQIVL